MKVLIFAGSSRTPSHTSVLAESINAALMERGAETSIVDLLSLNLPPADPAFHRDPTVHTNTSVRDLALAANAADAFVLLSPIYHNSYSGILKNALDNLAIAQFADKPVALGGHGDRSTQAVDHLRIVVRGLNGMAIPTQVCTDNSDYEETPEGFVLTAEKIKSRVSRLADELIGMSKVLSVYRQEKVAKE